jgi:hypothetical protein
LRDSDIAISILAADGHSRLGDRRLQTSEVPNFWSPAPPVKHKRVKRQHFPERQMAH